MIELDFKRPYRLLLVLPFFIATTGIAQGLFNTCNFLAARGMRDRGGEHEKITNREELRSVRRLGRRVLLLSVLSTLLATGLFLLVR